MKKELVEKIGAYLILDEEYNAACQEENEQREKELENLKLNMIIKISKIDKEMATALVLNTEKIKILYNKYKAEEK